ncbi:MAG: tetraacyldisaccharide 4'-kinase [Crocinitomicaceae bacterium]|nr:tetraacyldisaccharide 4'-kinase [Crocinitomicaceae bacterium]
MRFLLFPFAILYGIITWVRNKLFDWGLKKSYSIPFPSICVGNISVGGTGKTPHVLLFNKWLSEENEITIVSRGYGRKTSGLLLADENSNADTIGDEPMLFHLANPQPNVIVSEKRVLAIHEVEKQKNKSVVILDDAFQHRHVKAGFNVLMCDFKKPYFKDFMLPTGDLREFKSGEKRADIVIVSKCPEELSDQEKQDFRNNIHLPENDIYFSSIVYGEMKKWGEFELPNDLKNIVLVTGIANPKPLEESLSKKFSLKSVIFPDHHTFTTKDLTVIHENFGNFASENSIILTTEKDAVRLEAFKKAGELKNFPWFVQKMDVQVYRETELKDKLLAYVRKA